MATYREGYIFRIATSDPALFWSGYGDLLIPADSVVPDPAIALGAGELVNIPDFDQLINGTAERMEFTLSGVRDRTIAFAQEEAAEVPGAQVDIGRMDFDEDWQPVGAVEWEWRGEGKSLSVDSKSTGTGRERMIKLVVAAGSTSRTRAPISYFTDADQRRRSSDDGFFSHIAGITAGTSRRWGPR